MPKLVDAARSGDRRELYQGMVELLAETLENGCAEYTQAGIAKAIDMLVEKMDAMPKEMPDSPLERARRGA